MFDHPSSGSDISLLSGLLQESAKLTKDKTTEQPPVPSAPTKVVLRGQKEEQKSEAVAFADIWDSSEIPDEDAVGSIAKDDSRPAPRYEFCYKQAVGTEDTFLGISGKTPGSIDCTHLIVKVHFPGSTMKELDLDVTKNRIRAESRTHRLFTYLPQPVDYEKGVAKFDASKQVLTVTLPIVQEF